MIIKEIGEYKTKNKDVGRVSCIANNSEKFMSIEWGSIRFIDSFQFMPSSLERLGKNLSIEQKTCTMNYLKERFGSRFCDSELSEIVNKGKFPYSLFDSLKKL